MQQSSRTRTEQPKLLFLKLRRVASNVPRFARDNIIVSSAPGAVKPFRVAVLSVVWGEPLSPENFVSQLLHKSDVEFDPDEGEEIEEKAL
jgi:hypothetical protein